MLTQLLKMFGFPGVVLLGASMMGLISSSWARLGLVFLIIAIVAETTSNFLRTQQGKERDIKPPKQPKETKTVVPMIANASPATTMVDPTAVIPTAKTATVSSASSPDRASRAQVRARVRLQSSLALKKSSTMK